VSQASLPDLDGLDVRAADRLEAFVTMVQTRHRKPEAYAIEI
jgi:hypothetical protein